MKKNDSNLLLACLGAIALVAILLFFVPMLNFGLAYCGGWICKVTFGPTLCKALNTLFNVTFFSPDKLPLIAGALGWIGSYFKSYKSTSSKK